MAKSFTPIYVYPNKGVQEFKGIESDEKITKVIENMPHSQYDGWWPSFFPSTIGFLATAFGKATNVMTVSCVTVTNAYPFMLGFPIFCGEYSERGSGPRYSLELLEKSNEFTINIGGISEKMTKNVLICGSMTGRDGVDKFARSNFTRIKSRVVVAPIIKECQLNFECRVHSMTKLGTHTWVMGFVLSVHLDKEIATGNKKIIWRSMPEIS